jgi:putative Mn2+ efflux pump MntP
MLFKCRANRTRSINCSSREALLEFLEVVLIGLGLAMDAFAVSIAAGTSGKLQAGRGTFRLSFHFGLFQFLMPVIGWLLGTTVAALIISIDHWVAFGLLAFVGGRMILSGIKEDQTGFQMDPSRGMRLVILSISTSIDALAVGLSLAFLSVSIWYPSVVIGLVTAVVSYIGIKLGIKIGVLIGRRMDIIGGMMLCLIGLRILLGHLLGGH